MCGVCGQQTSEGKENTALAMQAIYGDRDRRNGIVPLTTSPVVHRRWKEVEAKISALT